MPAPGPATPAPASGSNWRRGAPLAAAVVICTAIISLAHLHEQAQSNEDAHRQGDDGDAFSRLLPRLRSGEDILVVITGGSVATGHPVAGYARSYGQIFVDELNTRHAGCPGCGRFRVENMAHGCTTTFFSAMIMSALVRREASIIVWGHGINDSADMDGVGFREAMTMYLHSAFLHCPHCIVGLAYTMDTSSYPPHTNKLDGADAIVDAYVARGFPVFKANLARHLRANTRAWPRGAVYFSDGVHLLPGPHKALGKLLYASLAPLLAPATRPDAGVASARGSTLPAARRAFTPTSTDVAFRCGLPPLYHWLVRAQSMEAVSADQPTLNIPARWFTRLDPKFKAAPTRNDRIVQVPFRPCPHKLTYAFNKRTNATRVLLGFGMQGAAPDLSGLAPSGSVTCINVETAPWCHTCGHSRDFDVWRLCHVPATRNPNATVAFCGTGHLRFMTFIEIAEDHGARHAAHLVARLSTHHDVARCHHE